MVGSTLAGARRDLADLVDRRSQAPVGDRQGVVSRQDYGREPPAPCLAWWLEKSPWREPSGGDRGCQVSQTINSYTPDHSLPSPVNVATNDRAPPWSRCSQR